MPAFGRIGKREGEGEGRGTEDRQVAQTERKRRRSTSDGRCLEMRSRSSPGSWDQSVSAAAIWIGFLTLIPRNGLWLIRLSTTVNAIHQKCGDAGRNWILGGGILRSFIIISESPAE